MTVMIYLTYLLLILRSEVFEIVGTCHSHLCYVCVSSCVLCMWVQFYSIYGCTCVCVSAWCPKQSDAPADSAPPALCPVALSVSASSGDCQASLVWLHKGPASFEVLKTSIYASPWTKKKAPSPFESSSNTGRHCGHASLALISQILKPVCGEQDLRG